VSRAKFAAYISQVEEITNRLQNIAHPPTHHHHHHHESLLFPSLSASYHKEKEDPHFHDLLLKYEGIHDGVSQTFSELAYRLQNVKKAKEKEDKAKEKAEKEKKEAVEKVEKEKEQLEKKVEKVEEHKDDIIEKKEKREEKRDKAVEDLVEEKLSKDTIKEMDRLGTVMG
jgi:flagellar biosynthesis GTPase FlhF